MITIEVREGDISRFAGDAVVNAANSHLWMGAGVAGALRRAGGPEIEEEAVRQGPITVGEAVVTSGGRLPAKYVIHAAVMGQNLRTDAAKIRAATINSLRRADELRLLTVAFPALGTGVGGFPLEECARVMLETVRECGRGATGIETVVFVLYGEPAYRVFREALERQGD